MFNRVIVVDVSRPETQLPQLEIGRYSAFLTWIKGVPADASDVKFVRTDLNGSNAVSWDVTKDASGGWSLYIRSGFFAEVGKYHYELDFYRNGDVFWSGEGVFIVNPTVGGAGTADVGPTGPRGESGPTGPTGSGATGPTGVTGPKGRAGVYVGATAPEDMDDTVWIDPDGAAVVNVVAADVLVYRADVDMTGSGAVAVHLYAAVQNPSPSGIDLTRSCVEGGYDASVALGTDAGIVAVIAKWKATSSARAYNEFYFYGNGSAAKKVSGQKTALSCSFTGHTEKDATVAPKAAGLTPAGVTALFANAVSSTASTTLKDRDCSVVAFTAGMVLSFAASTGLRQFEILITGCTASGSINFPDCTYRGASDALTLEAGDNHLVFAEYATGCFFVTRAVANTITVE